MDMEFAQMPSSNNAAASASSNAEALSTADQKIMADLHVVIEKMDLLDAMIKPSADAPDRDSLLTVIGFLEACAPRMIELVEAAAQGALSGSVLEKCLEVNDRLLKQLQDVDTMSMMASETSASAATGGGPPTDDLANLFLDDDDDDHHKKKPAPATKSTGEDDDLGDLFGEGKLPAEDSPLDVPAKDSFDDFISERTAQGKSEE